MRGVTAFDGAGTRSPSPPYPDHVRYVPERGSNTALDMEGKYEGKLEGGNVRGKYEGTNRIRRGGRPPGGLAQGAASGTSTPLSPQHY